MARFFSEQDIDGFRECFFLNAPSGTLKSSDQLTAVMRSLGFSPTRLEAKKYYNEKCGGSSGKLLQFADFLDIIHTHCQKENTKQEILAAFKAGDRTGRGYINAQELKHLLTGFGESISHREVEGIFREANISPRGQVKYEEFLKLMMSPPPDYY